MVGVYWEAQLAWSAAAGFELPGLELLELPSFELPGLELLELPGLELAALELLEFEE